MPMPVVSGWSSSRSTDAATSRPGLVADREDERDRQRAVGHREVDAEVARLQHQPDAALDAGQRVRHRPQAGAVHPVDQAVAVGAEQRHLPRRLDQRPLELRIAGLGEPGGVADGAARADRGQLADDVDRRLRVDADERRVGRLRQVGDRAVGALVARVHRVHRALEAAVDADLPRHGREPATDEGDRPRSQQPPGVHRPRKTGERFSVNAASASRWSSVCGADQARRLLGLELLAERARGRGLQQALGEADGDARAGRQLGRQAGARRGQVVARHDLGDEPVTLRLGRVPALARVDEPLRGLEAHQSRVQPRAADVGVVADPRVGAEEHGVVGRDAEVARAGQVETGADGGPVQHRHGRLRQVVHLLHQGVRVALPQRARTRPPRPRSNRPSRSRRRRRRTPCPHRRARRSGSPRRRRRRRRPRGAPRAGRC